MKISLLPASFLLLLLTFNSQFVNAQTKPAISYQTPQVYTVGNAITPLILNNTGGAVPAGIYSGVSTLVESAYKGYNDPTGQARIYEGFRGIASDAQNNLYVADVEVNKILKITPTGVITTFAGTGAIGSANGAASVATFDAPIDVVMDAAGNLYVADIGNNMIRKITHGGVVTTFAGQKSSGYADGIGTAARFSGPDHLAIDASGNIYVNDGANHVIRKITPAGVVTTFAGNINTYSSFGNLAVDPAGNVYVIDQGYLKKVTSTGVLSIITGNGQDVDYMNIDQAGNIYIGDDGSIRKITPSGVTTTVAGLSGTNGYRNGIGVNARFGPIWKVGFDRLGNLYASDMQNYAMRKITLTGYKIDKLLPPGLSFDFATGTISGTPTVSFPATTYTVTAYNASGSSDATISLQVQDQLPAISYAGPKNYTKDITITPLVPSITGSTIPQNPYLQVSTLAGKGSDLGFGDSNDTTRRFNKPAGIVTDSAGNIYIADEGNRVIRKRTPDGKITIFAGSGNAASVDGKGTAASFTDPVNLAIDKSGNLYVGDNGLNLIRKITTAGLVTTLAGSTAGWAEGTGTAAKFGYIAGLVVAPDGTVYVSDQSNHLIRKITHGGAVTAFAGTGVRGQPYNSGSYISAKRNEFNFVRPGCITIGKTSSGPAIIGIDGSNEIVFMPFAAEAKLEAYPIRSSFIPYNVTGITEDLSNNNIYLVDPYGVYDMYNQQNPFLAGGGAKDSAAVEAGFKIPFGLTLDATKKNLLVTDRGNNVVRQINISTRAVSTVAGKIVLDGTGTSAKFNQPAALATDGTGNVYVADTKNNLVRKITSAGVTTTFAGTGFAGSANGEGAAASFASPQAVAVDAAQNIYIGDNALGLVRKITPGGVVTTFAGSTKGFANGTGTAAQFGSVTGLATDVAGNVYVADAVNRRIRKITPAGVVTTFAGSGATGSANGVGTGASFIHPVSLTIDGDGNMFVSDSLTVRKITKTAIVSTFAGSGTPGSVDARGILASFTSLAGITSDGAGSIYVIDGNTIRKITHGSDVSTISGRSDAGSSNGEGIAASFNHPYGLTADAFGNLYVGDTGNSLIRKINLTGYVIRPKLPDGLVFDSKTGIISGTPTVLSPPTDYTISGYNGSGNGAATVNIEVSETDSLIARLAANEPMVKQALSPNGDGINNALIINNIEKYPNNKLVLMNNSGNTIYQVTGYDNSSRVFDGHSNITKALQQPGTYYYMLEYSNNGSIKRKTGYFIIKY